MTKNVGSIDQSLRAVFAAVCAGLILFEVVSGTLAVILVVVALILVITSLKGICPLYSLFGIKTCQTH